MRFRLLLIPFAALALSVVALACSSGGDDDAGDNGDQPAATTEAPDGDGDGDQPTATTDADDGDGSGSGNGTGAGNALLTIGDESWSFDDIFCAFSPEEAGNARVSFFVSSFGESSTGARTQLDATIQDPAQEGRYDGENVIKTVSLNDVEDFENPSVDWSSISGFSIAELDFQVDGKNVAVSAAFNDGTTDDIETVPGTLIATCP